MNIELTNEKKYEHNVTLFRIKAAKTFKNQDNIIEKGTLGGWIESLFLKDESERISDNAWVYGNAKVFGNARVFGNAWISDNARVFGDVWISDNAWVCNNARV